MSKATSALTYLVEQLETLYPTKIGRDALQTTSDSLPVITVWSQSDWQNESRRYTREVMIEVKIIATDTYHEDLDDALEDIRELLKWSPQVLGGYAVELRQKPARFFAPEDTVAVLQFPFEFDYIGEF